MARRAERGILRLPVRPRPAVAAAGLPPGRSAWLAGLLRLEPGPLSAEEIAEALRLHLSYSPDDLFAPDWAAAALFDAEPACNETLQVIEFANLQLLEYRNIDSRLDSNLAGAYRLVHETTPASACASGAATTSRCACSAS